MVKHLEYWKSDNRLILIDFSVKEERYSGVNRFDYELCWAEKEDCLEMVRNSWFDDDGRNSMQRAVNRLKACSKSLQRWNGRNEWNMKKDITAKKKELSCLGEVDGVVDWKMKYKIENDLDGLLRCEEGFWRQRSRISWLNEGDRNMKFFHAKDSSRRSRNRLRGLFDAGEVWKDDEIQMERIIDQYFTDIFTSSQSSHDKLNMVCGSVASRIPSSIRHFLDTRFTAEEVRVALFQMSSSKAPGIDAFPADFYQRFWDMVREDVIKMCLECLNEWRPVGMINLTLLCLIPKVKNVERVTNLRPISLCIFVYKCISKTITNCLQKVLDCVISETEITFVRVRLIMDNAMVGFEFMQALRQKVQ
ncbi:hypothetical protein Dsin_005396 [Dipteronia sinensis]|uniref:Reverse transcriptase domain-containing protein n=1 Tax=Dipteronia sinensis TaxID=43782 RepID=A0AAE0EEW0_9ROSI|nr:hypothetical protein Dsin_005396 [Dipteronia sinensis]